MKQVLAGLIFGGFVVAGWLLARRGSLPLLETRRKAAVSAFLCYALGASFAAGLSQKNLWPFSHWPLIAGVVPQRIREMHVVGVDTAGREHEIDYRAWEPMAFRELGAWLTRYFPRLDSADQDRAAAYLLQMAERARRRAREGGGVGYLDRFLGPLAAPYFLLHPKRWEVPEAVPPTRFVRLRMYWLTWDVIERARGSTRAERRDVYEYPRP